MSSLRPALALVGLFTVAGCNMKFGAPPSSASKPAPSRSEAPMPAAQAGTATEARDQSAKKPSRAQRREAERKAHRERIGDGHVVANLMAFNNADISYARIAASRSRNEEVRAYAVRMLTDNASINQFAMQLVSRTDIELEDDQTTLDLREISAARRVQLRELSGTAFDIAYIEQEIAFHADLLARIDEVFIPSAKNEDLKKLVRAVRPTVAAHLMQAESIGATFGLPASGIRP